MVSSFDNLSVVQNNDGITVADSGQTMGNDKNSTSFHQVIHTLLHNAFCSCINTGGRLVQNQYRRIRHCSSCNGEQLSLSLGKFFPVTA